MESTNNSETTYQTIREEIKSISSKGINTVIIENKNHKDRRRFVKIYYKKLDSLIYNTTIDRKYINFFILLVNLNANYIEPDTNLIKLQIKQIAENMKYSIEHTYKLLNILKRLNLIDFYKVGTIKYVVINPKYFAKFYDIRYMYSVEYAFENEKVSVSDLIGQISICKDFKLDKKNKQVELEVNQYMRDHFLSDN